MKAQIYINRHIVASNKKQTNLTGVIVDEPAIAVNTYKGSTYCKRVTLAPGVELIQDAHNARCSGATIWIQVDDVKQIEVA